MNKHYTESELIYPSHEKKVSTDTHFYGDEPWDAWIENGVYYLGYLSGEHAGRHKEIQISFEEFEKLKHDKTTFGSIL